MKDNYIIINKSQIEKRVEELEIWSKHNEKVGDYDTEGYIAHELKQILSQSTPLIPVVEKAFDIGSLKTEECYNKTNGFVSGIIYSDKQDYILNLKLDI